MITLHKLLPLALSPIVLAAVLVALSLLFRKPRLGWLGLALLWLASLPVVSYPFVRFVEGGSEVGRPSAHQAPQAQAVVVLGGGSTTVRAVQGPGSAASSPSGQGPGLTREWNRAADRFAAGVELMRLGKAPKLILTGGRLPWERLPDTEGDWLRALAVAQGVPEASIVVTGPVENTAQEAQAVAQLLPGGRIILVTSAFHMPRARALFEARGLSVLPFPVDFQVPERAMTAMDWLPDAFALELTDMAWRELLGRAYYTVRGW